MQISYTRQFIQAHLCFSRFKAIFLYDNAVFFVALHRCQDVGTWIAPHVGQYFLVALLLVQFNRYPFHQFLTGGIVGCSAQVDPGLERRRSRCHNGGVGWLCRRRCIACFWLWSSALLGFGNAGFFFFRLGNLHFFSCRQGIIFHHSKYLGFNSRAVVGGHIVFIFAVAKNKVQSYIDLGVLGIAQVDYRTDVVGGGVDLYWPQVNGSASTHLETNALYLC